jgi:hypothetical protein
MRLRRVLCMRFAANLLAAYHAPNCVQMATSANLDPKWQRDHANQLS